MEVHLQHAIRKTIRTICNSALMAVIALLLLLLGCDGGGSGGGGNVPPTANAGADQTIEEESIVNLVGSGSDSDGTIVSYGWRQTAGFAVTLNDTSTAATAFTAPSVSEQILLAFRLTVTDNDGMNASDEVTVTVNPLNAPPIADAGTDQFVTVQTPTVVTLDGSGTDSDGSITSYNWVQTPSGTAVTLTGADTATPSFTAPEVTERLTFRLTVIDNEGAADSDDTNVSVAQVLFSDDFEDGNDDGWAQVDDTGNGFSWQVISGEYYQLDYVESLHPGNPLDQSYHLGTYSFLNSGLGLTNYRFSVDITPLPDDGDDLSQGNDVGVMFRYQDISYDYYRFTLNSRYGFSRLEKKVNGIFSTLAVDSAGYYEGKTLNITVEVNGDLIQVFLNGDPLFSVSDSSLSEGTIALYCQDRAQFDNVLVTENNPAPSVVISEPFAYCIGTTDAGTLNVSAIATNVPLSGEVEFVLDHATSITVSSSPYTAQFTSVPQGEHTVDAILRDGSGSELASDTNVQIGVLGDYYIAVGDSITNGGADNYSSDNTSQDGRIIGIQGYEANLNDLLTSTLNYPHIVFNEGIGGDTSQEAFECRIDSILERHPESNKALILLGTNDSSTVAPQDFKENMQNIVDSVVGAGKEAWVAYVPPVFDSDGIPDEDRNAKILDYNDVISNELDSIERGPDFYNYFIGYDRSSLFADHSHPNGLGYAVMAYLWHNALNPGNQVQLPLVLDNLDPLGYKQNLLEKGDNYYIDETYSLTDIPPELDGATWIMTANADKTNSTSDFLSFEVDRNVAVYVGYHSDASTLPEWLLDFADSGLEIGTTNGLLNLYAKDFASGTRVTLGGNHAGGGDGGSNYVVILVASS